MIAVMTIDFERFWNCQNLAADQLILEQAVKGPKREIFVAGVFAQIRPVWIGDLETRPKNPKKLCLGP